MRPCVRAYCSIAPLPSRRRGSFYTCIPSAFGTDTPPLIDSEAALQGKVQVLDALMEIEVASSILNAEVRWCCCCCW